MMCHCKPWLGEVCQKPMGTDFSLWSEGHLLEKAKLFKQPAFGSLLSCLCLAAP